MRFFAWKAGASRHERQMIVIAPPSIAHRPPAADVAVRHWFRISGVLDFSMIYGLFKPPLDLAVVGNEFLSPEALWLEVTCRNDDVHVLGKPSLNLRDQIRIGAKLKNRSALGFPAQLSIDDFV